MIKGNYTTVSFPVFLDVMKGSHYQVVCEAEMGLADDAPSTYELTCGEANVDVDPNLGVLNCVSCPQCFGELYLIQIRATSEF